MGLETYPPRSPLYILVSVDQPLADEQKRRAFSSVPLPHIEPPGPLHKVQFVIEIVGPRTIPAASAMAILQPNWMASLGQPEVWAMAPADRQWKLLGQSPAPAYDSLALCWDLVSERGTLTSLSAQQLERMAGQFAAQIERRAIAIPVPSEVDHRVAHVSAIRESLDIGVTLIGLPREGAVPESGIWEAASQIGLTLSGRGQFELRQEGWDLPLLSMVPLGTADAFTLGAVHAKAAHPGLALGFRVPLSPSPAEVLEVGFQVADALGERLLLDWTDDLEVPLTAQHRDHMRHNLQQALAAFAQASLQPGSHEARRLFGEHAM